MRHNAHERRLVPAKFGGLVLVALGLCACTATPVAPVDTHIAAPKIEAITPPRGPATGGTRVLVDGAGFHPFARVLVGEVGALALSVAQDGKSLTFTTPPARHGGATEVRVINPGLLVAAWEEGFTYRPRPLITKLSPDEGPQGGGGEVRVEIDALVVEGGVRATLGGKRLDLDDLSSTGFAFELPPGRGVTDLRVVAGDNQIGVLPEAFRYVAPPRVRSVRPAVGAEGGGLAITVTGAGFREGATLRLGEAQALDVVRLSDNRLTAVTPPGARGLADVTVDDPRFADTLPLRGGFEYVPTPEVEAVDPASGPEAGGARIRVRGTGFLPGRTQIRFGDLLGLDASHDTPGVVEVTSPPGRGAVAVSALHDGVESDPLADAFTYVAPPAVETVDPVSGTTAGGEVVTITGRAFQEGAVVLFGNAEALAPSFESAERLVATAPPGPPGPARVRVRNPDGQTADLAGAYEYVPPPTLTTVTPAAGCETGGFEVVVAGAGFVAGTRIVLGDVEVDNVQVDDATRLSFTAPPGVGDVSMRALNPDGQTHTLEAAFTYDRRPRPERVLPDIGPLGGGTRLVIGGTCFALPDVATLGGAALLDVTLEDPTTLRATTPEGGSEGLVDLVLEVGGAGEPLAAAFRYNDGRLDEPSDWDDEHAAGSTVAALATDLDGDGREALVLASAPARDLPGAPNRALRNVDGRLELSWAAPLGVAGSSVASGDVDGDGRPDLWFGMEADGGDPPTGADALWRNLGDMRFERQAPPAPEVETTLAVAMADMDGDGDPDLLSAGLQGPHLFLNEGDWDFSDASDRLGLDASVIVLAMLPEDVDGDDDLDLLLATHSSGIILLLNDGRGIFRDATAEGLPGSNPNGVVALVAGDLDGDGDGDLVLGGEGPDRMWLRDDDLFVDATADRLPALDAQTTALALADLDSDGDLDVIVGLGGAIALVDVALDNDGQATFSDVSEAVLPDRLATRTQALVALDVDGDGAPDLYTGAAGTDLLDLD